jgi:hypothetical protein
MNQQDTKKNNRFETISVLKQHVQKQFVSETVPFRIEDVFFYVPLAYILHSLDSCGIFERICLPGDLEFSGIVCC